MKPSERNKKIITILGIFTIIFTVMGGSLAYWTWSSSEASKTNVSFSVGAGFSCSADGGGNITPTENIALIPTSDCTNSQTAIQRIIKVTPEIQRDNLTINMNMWLQVNNIGTGLSNTEYFKYALTTTEGSCTEGVVAEGDFKGTTAGSKVNLLENREYKGINILPETYYLYIWLHEDETDPNTMDQTFDFSLGGECTDAKNETLSHTIMSLANTEGSGVYEETTAGEYVKDYTVIPANESEWKSVEFISDINTLTKNTETNEWIISSDECTMWEYQETDECGDYDEETGHCHWYKEEEYCSGYRYDFEVKFTTKESGYYKLIDPDWIAEYSYNLNNQIYERWEVDSEFTIGYLTENDILSLTPEDYRIDDGYPEESLTLQFLKATFGESQYDAGYRYEGKEINNYIRFNNEIWRIIGVEEGGAIGLERGKYYTKIIRNESLGTAWYNHSDMGLDGDYYDNIVTDVLNDAYYNQGKTVYNNWDEEIELDYTETGLDSAAKELIVNANWYSINSHFYIDTPANTFANEKYHSNIIKSYVGLMSPSDYGYGALQSKCYNTDITTYSSCNTYNWLYSEQEEWLLSDSEQNQIEGFRNSHTTSGGGLGEAYWTEYEYRPVVYLDHKVIITNDGTGEIDRPYEIGLSK